MAPRNRRTVVPAPAEPAKTDSDVLHYQPDPESKFAHLTGTPIGPPINLAGADLAPLTVAAKHFLDVLREYDVRRSARDGRGDMSAVTRWGFVPLAALTCEQEMQALGLGKHHPNGGVANGPQQAAVVNLYILLRELRGIARAQIDPAEGWGQVMDSGVWATPFASLHGYVGEVSFIVEDLQKDPLAADREKQEPAPKAEAPTIVSLGDFTYRLDNGPARKQGVPADNVLQSYLDDPNGKFAATEVLTTPEIQQRSGIKSSISRIFRELKTGPLGAAIECPGRENKGQGYRVRIRRGDNLPG